jgi:hypothetical protein
VGKVIVCVDFVKKKRGKIYSILEKSERIMLCCFAAGGKKRAWRSQPCTHTKKMKIKGFWCSDDRDNYFNFRD